MPVAPVYRGWNSPHSLDRGIAKTYFDTNTSDHHHYFIEEEGRLIDIPEGPVAVENLPPPPDGMEIANIDVVVRLRRKRPADPPGAANVRPNFCLARILA